jgi:hypothetical protein
MDLKKLCAAWAVSIVVGLYTTFVLLSMWNWFAVQALHGPEIHYWTMYGLMMLIRLVFEPPVFKEKEVFGRLEILIRACVPEEKRDQLDATLKEEEKGFAARAGWSAVGQAIGASIALGLGWAIHSFLA